MATQAQDATSRTEEEAGNPDAVITQPEKLGESTKEAPYEIKRKYSVPEELAGTFDNPDRAYVVEYYDRFQNWQPYSWAEPRLGAEEAAQELREASRNRPTTSFRVVEVDKKVVLDES